MSRSLVFAFALVACAGHADRPPPALPSPMPPPPSSTPAVAVTPPPAPAPPEEVVVFVPGQSTGDGVVRDVDPREARRVIRELFPKSLPRREACPRPTEVAHTWVELDHLVAGDRQAGRLVATVSARAAGNLYVVDVATCTQSDFGDRLFVRGDRRWSESEPGELGPIVAVVLDRDGVTVLFEDGPVYAGLGERGRPRLVVLGEEERAQTSFVVPAKSGEAYCRAPASADVRTCISP